MRDTGCSSRSPEKCNGFSMSSCGMLDDDLTLTESQIADFAVRRYSKSGYARVVDRVAIEAPLEIRISYSFKEIRRAESAAVTMRTPGNDQELAAGFLFSEGVIS